MNSLINKGRCFALCIEQHPDAVQAGPFIEQLMDETLGKGWICPPKLLHRIGMQALTYGSTVEGIGSGARGFAGDARGDISAFREAYDNGEYLRVGELSKHSSQALLDAPYTVQAVRQRIQSAGRE